MNYRIKMIILIFIVLSAFTSGYCTDTTYGNYCNFGHVFRSGTSNDIGGINPLMILMKFVIVKVFVTQQKENGANVKNYIVSREFNQHQLKKNVQYIGIIVIREYPMINMDMIAY